MSVPSFVYGIALSVRLDRGVLKGEIGSPDKRRPRKDRKNSQESSSCQDFKIDGVAAEPLLVIPPVPSNSLFVHNLSWEITDDALLEYFGSAGNPVSADVKRSGKDGRSRGWAVVKYGTVEEASMAMLQLHESTLNGRKIPIRFDAKLIDAMQPCNTVH